MGILFDGGKVLYINFEEVLQITERSNLSKTKHELSVIYRDGRKSAFELSGEEYKEFATLYINLKYVLSRLKARKTIK